jgi:hypothetical protein
MVVATLVMAVVVYGLVSKVLPLYLADRGLLVVGPKFILIVFLGAIAYIVPCYAMRLKEARLFVSKLTNKIASSAVAINPFT